MSGDKKMCTEPAVTMKNGTADEIKPLINIAFAFWACSAPAMSKPTLFETRTPDKMPKASTNVITETASGLNLFFESFILNSSVKNPFAI